MATKMNFLKVQSKEDATTLLNGGNLNGYTMGTNDILLVPDEDEGGGAEVSLPEGLTLTPYDTNTYTPTVLTIGGEYPDEGMPQKLAKISGDGIEFSDPVWTEYNYVIKPGENFDLGSSGTFTSLSVSSPDARITMSNLYGSGIFEGVGFRASLYDPDPIIYLLPYATKNNYEQAGVSASFETLATREWVENLINGALEGDY